MSLPLATMTHPIVPLSESRSSAPGTFYHLVGGLEQREAPFKASLFVVEPGHQSREDAHEAAELWLLMEGEGILYYDGEQHAVRAPCALAFAPNRKHSLLCTGAGRALIGSVWWTA